MKLTLLLLALCCAWGQNRYEIDAEGKWAVSFSPSGVKMRALVAASPSHRARKKAERDAQARVFRAVRRDCISLPDGGLDLALSNLMSGLLKIPSLDRMQGVPDHP